MGLRLRILFFAVLVCAIQAVCAQSIRVATAANLQGVIKVLQSDFKRKTGINLETVLGSSGKLVAQISNGAPYDVFLSADMEFPQQLYDKGFATAAPVIYARGCLVIASRDKQNFNNWQQLLASDKIQKVAIANLAIAPYGRAAEECLRYYKLLDEVKPKTVNGESIAQVDTYIITSAVQVGFTTRALAVAPDATTRVYFKAIDPASYKPIDQGITLLKHARDSGNEAQAQKFYQYMLSADAQSILKRHGYIIP